MVYRVCGIDPGTKHCGVAVLGLDAASRESLLHHTVLHMRHGTPAERILDCKRALVALVQQWQPCVIAVEKFVWEARETTQFEFMNWLVGICLDLGTLVTPEAPVWLYSVSEWRRQLIGTNGRWRGSLGKDAAADILTLRLGQAHWATGYHDADAAGLALVAPMRSGRSSGCVGGTGPSMGRVGTGARHGFRKRRRHPRCWYGGCEMERSLCNGRYCLHLSQERPAIQRRESVLSLVRRSIRASGSPQDGPCCHDGFQYDHCLT